MAVYNIQIPENASKKSLEQVTAYLYRLNEQLTYMFNNITPEENYSNEAYVKYIQEGERVTNIEVSLGKVSASVQQNTKDISRLEITSENIKLEMVKKGEVVSAINLSKEAVKIQASKIQLEGVVTANNYFKILENGKMQTTDGEFTGTVKASKVQGSTISGGTITGSHISAGTIEGCTIGDADGNFYTDGDIVYFGGFQAYSTKYGKYIGTIGTEENGIGTNRKYAIWSGWDGTEAAFYATTSGDISCNEIYSEVAGESWSDERLKDQIETLDPELMYELVKNLKPVSFVMKKAGKEGVGFLAQDVYLLCQKKGYRLPLYGYTPDRKYFTIPYQNYIAISIAAQQQTMKLMEQMEERIEELERMMKDGER